MELAKLLEPLWWSSAGASASGAGGAEQLQQTAPVRRAGQSRTLNLARLVLTDLVDRCVRDSGLCPRPLRPSSKLRQPSAPKRARNLAPSVPRRPLPRRYVSLPHQRLPIRGPWPQHLTVCSGRRLGTASSVARLLSVSSSGAEASFTSVVRPPAKTMERRYTRMARFQAKWLLLSPPKQVVKAW